jgi:hypothetical protein
MSAGSRPTVSNRSRLPRVTALLATLILTLSPAIARAQSAQPFDGKWATTVTCKSTKDPATAGIKFVTEVRDGVLAGQVGTEGTPGFLRIDGKVTPAGVGHVYAKGLSVPGDSVSGRELPAGTEYTYYILAKFEGKGGAGNRVEGRKCEIKFEKK